MSLQRLTKIIEPNNFKISKWSGGTTTELFIYPLTENFQDRNFDFRLSTATVDVETSLFTPLNGYNRVLMVLKGEMELIHKNHHNKRLKKFETDSFKGEWETESKGQCSDFNLIYRGDLDPELWGQSLVGNEEYSSEIHSKELVFIYCLSGVLSVSFEENVHKLEYGSLAKLATESLAEILVQGASSSEFVWVKIKTHG